MQKYMLALMALLTPVLLSAPAYAGDFAGDREGEVGGGRYSIERVTSALDDLVDVMGEVWKVMVSNPLFLVFLGVSLFSVGIWLFRKIRSAAKR